jgi:ribosomal protein L29
MLKAHEVRAQTVEERKARGVQAMGGSTPNPGKIRTLRREIARIHTIDRENQLGIRREPAK